MNRSGSSTGSSKLLPIDKFLEEEEDEHIERNNKINRNVIEVKYRGGSFNIDFVSEPETKKKIVYSTSLLYFFTLRVYTNFYSLRLCTILFQRLLPC